MASSSLTISLHPWLTKIKASIAELPISRTVINTHLHGDHTGGNAMFQKDAPVIAQDNVRKRLEAVAATASPRPKMLSHRYADHDVNVHLNGENIHALHFASGHTDG